MDHNNYQVPDDLNIDEEDYKALHPKAGYRPTQRRHRHRKLLVAVVIVIALVLLAAGGYWLWQQHKKNTATPPPTKHRSVQQKATKPASPVTDAGNGLKLYKTSLDNLNVSFEFPAAWTAQPIDKSDQTITVGSPILSFVGVDGATATGKIVVKLRYGPSSLTRQELTATGVQASVQYGYSAPTHDQHVYFYTSFLHYQGTAKDSFQEVAITGINPVAAGKPANGALQNVAPLVTASFYECANQTCSLAEAQPLSFKLEAWQSNSNLMQVQTLFESFKFS